MVAFQVEGDLALSEDETELLLVGGARAVEQQIRTGATNWKGYLPYDPDQGLPMTTDILGKNRDLRVVTQLFREWLAGIDGVTSVTSVSVALDAGARRLAVVFTVECESGETLSSEVTFATG